MLSAIFFLVIVVLTLGAIAYWLKLSPTEQDKFSEALGANIATLAALLAFITLPAALLLPLPEWLPHWLIATLGLSLWGVFVVCYWDGWKEKEGVVSAESLARKPGPPLPGVQPMPSSPLPPVLDGDAHKSFHWLFTPHNGLPVEMMVSVALSTKRYQDARAEPRRPAGDWAYYAEKEMPELDTLTATFMHLHLGRQWSTLEQASNTLCFAQICIDYKLDAESAPAAEWPRYPIETLMDEVGDCEDDVILAAAILKRLGFEVALLYYPGHCALGVAGADRLPGEYALDPSTGLKYFYGETTAEGWHLGEVPTEYRGRRPDKIEVVQRTVK